MSVYAIDMQGYRGYSIRRYSDDSVLIFFQGDEISTAKDIKDAKKQVDEWLWAP